ncbi:MAG: 4Fe-4S binding protein [Planctomycetota bacterium]|nr:4Fe-4S binding protein [Planctomycetota bacterium]
MPSNLAPAVPDIAEIAARFARALAGVPRRIIICAGTGCVANGALEVHRELTSQLAAAGLDVAVTLDVHDDAQRPDLLLSRSGCQGFCQMGPLVSVLPDGLLYTKVRAGDVAEIIAETILARRPIERLLYVNPRTGQRSRGTGDIPFYTRQSRRVLALCGVIDAEDVREYIHQGGYAGARKAYLEMMSEQICQCVTASGLRGRGGGGFPTGRKWEMTRKAPGPKKYIICNGDEGDPGAFMDRSVMEGTPHSVIEGMMIAARAVGADEGVIYVRAEYPLAVRRLRQAVADAQALGLLGENLFGTGTNFRVQVMEGAGAFVCGEETALMSSVEGQRGMPSPKPPFPATSGLWRKPTLINNVETLASVPMILREGPAHYASVGTPGSPGTKTFALTGHVANTGLIEVPLGTTLREIVFEIGGGVLDQAGRPSDEPFKAVQIGGPSGGCLTAEHLDLPLDFDSLKGVGAMVGSGGLVVMNQATCMVSVARFFMQFTQKESCGKCVLCREGTRQMLALLDEVTGGSATPRTLELLEQLGRVVQVGSLCGLGKTAPNPVLSTLKQFRAEYDAHVLEKRCPTGRCKGLARPEILADRCKGCRLCVKKCPVGAVSGEAKKPHRIDVDKCIKCGACAAACKFEAVVGVGN